MTTINVYALVENRDGHPDFGEPFYIGIGGSKRPGRHIRDARSAAGHANWRLQDVLGGHFSLGIKPHIEVVAVCPTREFACFLEIRAIAFYGRMGLDPDGTLTNIAAGGTNIDPVSSRWGWSDPTGRAKRIAAITGVPKTMTPEAIEARQINARLPRSEEVLAAQRAASERNWADPAFQLMRSRNQTIAWQDEDKRAKMLEGRSEGIAASWQNPAIREARTATISAVITNKWANDVDYAERARAGLRASWEDPATAEKRAEQMIETRRQRMAERSADPSQADAIEAERVAKSIRQSAVMTRVNASMTTEDRSALQTAAWIDPSTREHRSAGMKAAAQNPTLKAARLANMLAGKRRKAAERTAATQSKLL